MNTIWGTAQTRKTLAPGIVEVTTASHGGVILSPERNAQVHPKWRDKQGCYEEDCDWAIVAITFPKAYAGRMMADTGRYAGKTVVEYAHDVAKRWHPDEYMAVTGTVVTAAESGVLAEREFYAAHAEDWLATAAWGYRNVLAGRYAVPEGWVGVCARVGGHHKPGGEERYFLVPEGEYKDRSGWAAVVDPARHPAWPALPDEAEPVTVAICGTVPGRGKRALELFAAAPNHRGVRVGELWFYPAEGDLPERWGAYRTGHGGLAGFPSIEEALRAVGLRSVPFAVVLDETAAEAVLAKLIQSEGLDGANS